MPASRSARAMILAPRSCPSSPGLAMTTRIFRSTWAVYGGENHGHRLVPRLAQPGWGAMYRASGVSIDDRPELWVHRGGHAVLEQFGERFGFEDMFDRVFTVREYDAEEAFETAGIEVIPMRLPHYRLETYGFRLS